MRRFVSSATARARCGCRRRLLSTAAATAPRLILRVRPSDRLLPSNAFVYGGSEGERRSLEARLARVLRATPSLQQEAIGIVILDDKLGAPAADEGLAGDQQQRGQEQRESALAQAFSDFPLTSGSLLTVFNCGEQQRQQLVATQGEDVLEAWAKDSLRRHLASLGGGVIEARHPLILEPALLDLSSETGALEDDEELAWALSKKQPLAAAAVPGSFLPPRYLQPPGQRMVCLVFPRREVKSTEWLHRMQRQVADYARKNLVPTQTHFLDLARATAADPAVREAEARRFAQMASRLPPDTLVLAEEAALDVVVEWAARLNNNINNNNSSNNNSNNRGNGKAGAGGKPAAPLEVTTFNLALTNFLFKSPTDVFAGPRLLASLSARSTVLVAYHNPLSLSTAKAKAAAEQRGQRIAEVLDGLFEQRAKGDPRRKPQLVAGALHDHLPALDSYTLLVLHSGAHAVDDEAVQEVLNAASQASLPVITPGLLRAWFRAPRCLAAALRPWPPSFSFLADGGEPGSCTTTSNSTNSNDTAPGTGTPQQQQGQALAADRPWDMGFRRKASGDCSDCSSWACGECTKHQQSYAARLGEQHRREIGQEWRELF